MPRKSKQAPLVPSGWKMWCQYCYKYCTVQRQPSGRWAEVIELLSVECEHRLATIASDTGISNIVDVQPEWTGSWNE